MKKVLGSLLAVIGVGGGTYHYARNVEPYMLHIQNETIYSNKLPDSFRGFKIIHFSDTHIGFHYTLHQFKKLIEKINELNPDIIVFTGDLIDRPNKYKLHDKLLQHLQTLHAKQGKYWIFGNHDHGGYGTELLKTVMKEANFQLLNNEHVRIERNNDRIIIAGIDDVILGKPNIEAALAQANPDLFTILLAHEPDFADIAKHYDVDIQLSGHSHGGQIRLPIIGHVYTPLYATKYVEGKYVINDKFTLFVNKGIGTTRLPYRFLCKPEIHQYTLENTK